MAPFYITKYIGSSQLFKIDTNKNKRKKNQKLHTNKMVGNFLFYPQILYFDQEDIYKKNSKIENFVYHI